jgi:hypothetical protein
METRISENKGNTQLILSFPGFDDKWAVKLCYTLWAGISTVMVR